MTTNHALQTDDHINYLGLVELEGVHKTFGLGQGDRRRHTYIIGKSGMGKSTLLENMILQDIYAGFGCCYIDPLGDSAVSIMDRIPSYRHKDVVYFNPSDKSGSVGINLLEIANGQSPSLITSEIMSIMERVWSGVWSPRMEYILTNSLIALIENTEDHTLMGCMKMFNDPTFADKIAQNCNNMVVKQFWTKEYPAFPPNYKTEAVAAIQNKIGQLFTNEMVGQILGQAKSTINFEDILNTNKIFICNLSKGQIGESNCNLMGSLIVTKIQLAAMNRAQIPASERKDFYLYIDEFQNFVNDSFITILSEARKFRLNLIIAHQYLGQLSDDDDKIKQAIFGNVGTIISFQVSKKDAEYLGEEFQIELFQYFQNLGLGQVIIKPWIEQKQTSAFFAYTLRDLYQDYKGNYEKCRLLSNKLYTRKSTDIQREITAYYKSEPKDNAKARRNQKRLEEFLVKKGVEPNSSHNPPVDEVVNDQDEA